MHTKMYVFDIFQLNSKMGFGRYCEFVFADSVEIAHIDAWDNNPASASF